MQDRWTNQRSKKRKERKGVGKATGMNWYRWVYPRSTPDSGGRNQHIPMLLPASRLSSTTWYLEIVTSFPFPIRICICIWSSGKKGGVFASLWTLKSALATWVGVSFSRGTTGCSRVVHYQVHGTVHSTLQLGQSVHRLSRRDEAGPLSSRSECVFGSECLDALWPWCLINMAPHPWQLYLTML